MIHGTAFHMTLSCRAIPAASKKRRRLAAVPVGLSRETKRVGAVPGPGAFEHQEKPRRGAAVERIEVGNDAMALPQGRGEAVQRLHVCRIARSHSFRQHGRVSERRMRLSRWHGVVPHTARKPPSTGRVWPVVMEEVSSAKNRTADATSSTVASRRRGVASRTRLRARGSARRSRVSAVSTKVGATAYHPDPGAAPIRPRAPA